MGSPSSSWTKAPSSNPSRSWEHDKHSNEDWKTENLHRLTQNWDVTTQKMMAGSPSWTRTP